MSDSITLQELAERVGGELSGPKDRLVSGAAPVHSAGPQDITFLEDVRLASRLEDCKAAAVLLSTKTLAAGVPDSIAKIIVNQPYSAFVVLLEYFYPVIRDSFGVSPAAIVADDAQIDNGTNVYPGAYVGRGARIGTDSDLHPGVFIGDNVSIGSGCTLYPNVTIYKDCEIGDHVIIHSGAVIGADGFGYTQKQVPDNPMEPIVHQKIPQLGKVIIEDDVEIGANSTIDRATFDVTRIGKGTKIDNLVMLAHNCQIGVHSLLVAQVGVSGSTKIGNYVTLAGQAGVIGHVTVGDQVVIGAKAGVTKSLAAGKKYAGMPAIDFRKWSRSTVVLRSLPELKKALSDLEKRVQELESELDNS